MSTKRTSIDDTVDETSLDIQKPPRARLSFPLPGRATSVLRGSPIRASELERLDPSRQQPLEVVFDAEETLKNEGDGRSIVRKPSSAKARSKPVQEDAILLEDYEIEALVSRAE